MTTVATEAPPVLATRDVTKRFGATSVLRGVSVSAYAGRVLALLGDNGAGKSSLIKVLAGVYTPDSGRVEVDGRPCELKSPHTAREQGIATVFQDLAVCGLLSIARNVVLGQEPMRSMGPLRWLDVRESERIAAGALTKLGVHLPRPLSDPAAALSGGQRQAVAIARAVHYGSRVLILDEPTAALAVRQAEGVLDLVRRARDDGQAVILITHNFRQALSVADDIVVLAHGQVIGEFDAKRVTTQQLTDLVSQV